MKQYTAKSFLNELEIIPEVEWTTGFEILWDFDAHVEKKCALLHCKDTGEEIPEWVHLLHLVPKIQEINDGEGDYAEWGRSPKERVLYALKQLV